MNGAADSQPQPTAVRFGTMKQALIGACRTRPDSSCARRRTRSCAPRPRSTSAMFGRRKRQPCPHSTRASTRMPRRRWPKPRRTRVKISSSQSQQKRDFNQHDYSMQWTTAGQTPRLLSLQSELGSFEGGAHPNTVHGALLWDRSLKREIKINSLFLRGEAFDALTRTHYCSALERRTEQAASGREARSAGLQRLSQIFGARDRASRQEQQCPFRPC